MTDLILVELKTSKVMRVQAQKADGENSVSSVERREREREREKGLAKQTCLKLKRDLERYCAVELCRMASIAATKKIVNDRTANGEYEG